MPTLEPRLWDDGRQPLGHVDNEFYTPPWVFERLATRFDLDVCAPVGGVPWIPADTIYTEEDDGLASDWSGFVWCNPPFNDSGSWVDKFLDHGNGIALVMHCRSHWHSRIWAYADALVDPTAANPAGTLFAFVRPDGRVCHIFQPVFLVGCGLRATAALSRIGVVRGRLNAPPWPVKQGNVSQSTGRRGRVASIRGE